MSLVEAVIAAGIYPVGEADRADRKRYAERLSAALAPELAKLLREQGMPNVRPLPGGPGEKAFQGGLGPKRVDVTHSDEQHGLLFAVSIKSITTAPFSKNLKNRFGDLCTEAITLHMRFPYSVVCCLFAFPHSADNDTSPGRPQSTFQRATRLMATISGREEYTDPGEKFEDVAMMLFQPVTDAGDAPWVRLYNAATGRLITEDEYVASLVRLYNKRNPHLSIELDDD